MKHFLSLTMPRKKIAVTLGEHEVKTFLKDVEATGLERDDVNLIQVFDSRKTFYGDKGSARRDAFRKTFYPLKRNSISNYCKCTASFESDLTFESLADSIVSVSTCQQTIGVSSLASS